MKTVLILLLAIPVLALGQTAPAASGQPCSSPEHRQFDFWLGRWDVTQNDQPAGHNEITLEHGGCVLAEHWSSAQGNFTGSSFNLYDASRGVWHQTWTDSSGVLLLLDGGLQDNGTMVLTGTRKGSDGMSVTDRISWTPNADGSVRQWWQSHKGDQQWITVFDGIYRRAKAP